MKRIVPGAAIKLIASTIAPKVIVAFATLESIIAVKADEKVFATNAKDLIGVIGAVQRVVIFSAGNVSHGEFSSP